MKMPVYSLHIYIYILKHPSHAFHLFFHAFSPHLRGVNDLCRFLHELLHALDGRTLFSKRKGCWHQGQHEMSRLQVISFISHHTISLYLIVCRFMLFSSCFIFLMPSDAVAHSLAHAVLCEFMRCVSATLCFLLSCLSTNFNHDKF